MMKAKSLSTTLITFTVSVLLIALFAAPAPAVKKWREGKHRDAWQIWIAAVDFDRSGDGQERVKTGKEAKKAKKRLQSPWAEDVLVGPQANALAEYDFISPVEGKAYIRARVMSIGAGGQSWFISLNVKADPEVGLWGGPGVMILDTKNTWDFPQPKGLNNPKALSPTPLVKGKNFIHVRARESEALMEPLMDVFVVSTTPFFPVKDIFDTAVPKEGLSVKLEGKLATTWGTLKRDF